ncbi:MAG TPA: carboxylating nicotinate-nucleotide diphosphorylase [Gemmatimonadaceae bacterium]
MTIAFPLDDFEMRALVRAALDEDRAFDDATTSATVGPDVRASASMVARTEGVIAGLPLAVATFLALDSHAACTVRAIDGTHVAPGTIILELEGRAAAMLSAERVALNFVQRLSGVATLTSRYVAAVAGTGATILDTRKTTPGYRALEKYAVRCGGGTNHRADLAGAVLIKDNHLAAMGGDIAEAVRRARALARPGIVIQVECDDIPQVRAAVDAGADSVLLDNMSPAMLRKCVGLVAGRAITEASGGITLETVRRAAESGVNRISVGALTHSAPALDIALDFTQLG